MRKALVCMAAREGDEPEDAACAPVALVSAERRDERNVSEERKRLHNGGWGPSKPCRWCGKLVHTCKDGSLRFTSCKVREPHPEFGWMQSCQALSDVPTPAEST